jgi:protein phosphatase
MGTTIVCAVVHGDTVQLANVGDSPAFLVTNGTTRQVTHDHAWVAEQLEMGTLTEEEAARHPFRHVLTRCLGAEDKVEVELYEPFALGDGDALVLCSDGLTEHVQTEEIGKLTREAPSLDAAARALVDLANSRGGVDNITVVIARLAARD